MVFVFAYYIYQLLNSGSEEATSITDLKVCSYVRLNQPCTDNMLSMEKDVQDIYATFYVNNLEAGSLEAKWYYTEGGVESEIGTSEEEIFESGVVQFKLEKNYAKGWLEGDYRVAVTLDSPRETIEQEFEITPEL